MTKRETATRLVSDQPRRIILNGAPSVRTERTLAELCAALGFDDCEIATALNGTFVPRSLRGDHAIATGDTIEIVSPRQGG